MKYYSVTAQFGHVGRGKYIPKTVPVRAEDGKDAAEKVRWMPRVKHHKKDAILCVKKISKEEYQELKIVKKNDPYFTVGSKQEQARLCPDLANYIVSRRVYRKKRKSQRDDIVRYKMKKNKIMNSEARYSMRNFESLAMY